MRQIKFFIMKWSWKNKKVSIDRIPIRIKPSYSYEHICNRLFFENTDTSVLYDTRNSVDSILSELLHEG